MFTGIIENIGILSSIEPQEDNIVFGIKSDISHLLKIDQSLSHDGVCLTVTAIQGDTHYVTAVAETLHKTHLSKWQLQKKINLERCMQLNARFDGHIVQGHVDTIATCTSIKNENGSYRISFTIPSEHATHIIEKGSITLNGISLTLVDVGTSSFSVAIIPYTWQHTNLHELRPSDPVNIEFDIIGKYIQRILSLRSIPNTH